MITVLIRATHGPEALVTTLSSLIPAVTAGLVGDAVILAAAHRDDLSAVADATGATLVLSQDTSWRRGAQAARRDWLLCLEDGDVPQEGWIRVLDRFITLGTTRPSLGRLRRRNGFLRARLESCRGLLGRSSVQAGDLVHRRVLLEAATIRSPVPLPAIIERDPAFG